MKKKIIASNLLLRFYLSEGWTKEELDELCIRGESFIAHKNDENPYLILHHDTALDLKKLEETKDSWELHRTYDDYPHETDIEFIERMM